jgi:hypothetical protein
MGDNDFPAVGFLREYVEGMEDYSQAGTDDIPFVGQQLISSTPSFEINEKPSIDPDIYLPGLTKRINYAKRQLGRPDSWTEDQVRQYSKIKGV